MKKIKQISVVISVLTVICMLSTSIAPIFAQGTTGAYILETDEKSVELSKEPIQNEMGLMVSVCEVLDAIDIQYEHDKDLDSFEIFLEENNIMLMHNATHYYKGEESIDCQPYFTVNDVPLIELGFLCQLIDYEYEFDAEERKIVINKVQDNSNESEMIEPEIVVSEEATEEPSEETTEEPSVTLVEENNVMLMASASGGASGGSVVVGGTSSSATPSGNGTLSGTINLPAAAPEGGINISLVLENTRAVYRSLYGTSAYYYDAGSQYTVANINFSEGEKSKSYSFDAGKYQNSSSYSEYVIFYETDSNEIIDTMGYVKNDGTTHFTSKLTTEGELRDGIDIKLFKYGNDITTNISITEKDMSCGENAFWSYDKESKILTISGTGDMYNYGSYNTGWSGYREEIKKIVIEEGITSIGEYAFYGCTLLESVDIPKSVNKIGAYSFRNCYELQSVVIPDGVTEIKSYTFYNCQNLKLVVIPKSVISIYYNAFGYYDKLNLAYSGSENEWNKIGCEEYFNEKYFNYKEFAKVNGIDYLIRNDSTAVVIGGLDESVTLLTIPEEVNGARVTELSTGAFYNKINLISVTLPNNLEKIGERAFYQCTGLIGVNIRDNVNFIGEYAFFGCNNLTNITLPKKLTQIGRYSFNGCYNITKITIPENVHTIENNAFANCSGLNELIIPDSVSTIGNSAFYYCRNLKKISIGNGVSNIGSGAFSSCYNVTDVYIKDLDAWCEISFASSTSNPLYDGANLYINNELANGIIIPDDVTQIKDYAFIGCSSLQNVSLHENITKIGTHSFSDCWKLTKINLPDSILQIGDYAFNGCALKTVEIPKDIQIIDEYTFYGCDFTTVTIPSSVIAIKACAFSYCSYLTEVTVSSYNTQIVGTAFDKTSLKIYGLIGSAAETYASTKGYVFEAMDDVVYSITFDSNGGTSAPSKQNKGFGTPISLTREYPVKKHCTFLGWSTTADGEVEYLSGDTFNEDKDIVLYAVWAEPTITVKSKSGVIGKEVKVTIDIKNNPGIAGMLLKLNYAPELTLKKVEKGSALENLVFTEPGDLTSNPVNLLWDGMDADASNGEIIILTFEIPANTEEKDYTISLSYESDDVYDAEMSDIDVKLVSGILSSKRVSKGDMDGDDKINTKDITLLRRFIAGGYSTENIVPEAADIDNDTAVNTRDVVLLRRFIAGGYGIELN